MIMNKDGKLGIGTNNPNKKLHIEGDIKVSGDLYTGSKTISLANLEDLTGKVQTQLDSKQPTITGALTSFASSNATVDRVIISNASGKLSVSDITSTELGYLDGVTSNIQSQISNIGTNGAISTVLSNNLNQDRAII